MQYSLRYWRPLLRVEIWDARKRRGMSSSGTRTLSTPLPSKLRAVGTENPSVYRPRRSHSLSGVLKLIVVNFPSEVLRAFSRFPAQTQPAWRQPPPMLPLFRFCKHPTHNGLDPITKQGGGGVFFWIAGLFPAEWGVGMRVRQMWIVESKSGSEVALTKPKLAKMVYAEARCLLGLPRGMDAGNLDRSRQCWKAGQTRDCTAAACRVDKTKFCTVAHRPDSAVPTQ